MFARHVRRFAALGSVLFATTLGVADQETSNRNLIEFKTYVRSTNGVVRCGLFTEKGWLRDPVQPARARIHGPTALCVFQRVPVGVYAISAFHDENGNGKIDTNLLGMPTEDYCASRNARGTFGPPSFDSARFKYPGGRKQLEARMK